MAVMILATGDTEMNGAVYSLNLLTGLSRGIENITVLWVKGYVQGIFKKLWEPKERSSYKFS